MVLRDRAKQADFFLRIRSCECVGLRSEDRRPIARLLRDEPLFCVLT